jgi:hypothetical protein
MRLAMLTGCAAAPSLLGAGGACAETVYVTDPYIQPAPAYTYAAPTYTYSVPGPLPFSRFVVTERAPMVVAEPPVVAAAPPAAVVEPPVMAALPPASGIVTTGYSTVRSCFTGLSGIERCY